MAQNTCLFFGTFLIILSILSLFGKVVALDCYRTTTHEYKGHQQTTEDGHTCIRWDSFDHKYSDPESVEEATTSEDENYCRDPDRNGYLWCYVSSDGDSDECDIEKCVTVDVNQCGSLKIEQPTILGRNVTFTFTPETTSDADVKWQRASERNSWSILPDSFRFTQYFQDGTYYLVLTDTVKGNDEVFYRVDYKNNSVSCLMETPKLKLKVVASDCYRTTTYEYKGQQHTTKDEQTCIRWDSFDHKYRDSEKYTEATTSEDKNYCRDPGRNGYLWCYVSSNVWSYEECDIEKCDIISNLCGFVYLRTTMVKEGENVELEYYPSKYVMQNQEHTVRQWTRSEQNSTIPITLTKDVYEEEKELNDKYVLTIFMFKERMNGRYGVYCGETEGYSNDVEVILPVAPSAPAFEGLKDIDDCKGCIVGEDGDQFSVLCKTSGGTQPIKVTMSIGNVSLSPNRYNETAGYIKYFTLSNSHHMANMTCSVVNDALASPLIITARVYVIKSPKFQSFTVPQTLKERNNGTIACIVDGGRPAPHVTLNISGMEVSSAVQTDSSNASTSLYTSVVSLTTFERIWNSEKVQCCRFNEWYSIKSACSSPKRFNFMFPPSNIKLEVKVEQKHEIYAVCTIYNSNPACGVNISAPNGIIVSERYTNNVIQAHGAWDLEYAVNLSVGKDYNGEKIECAAHCQHFDVDLKDARWIVLPYAPIIEFNISGSEITILQGEQAHLKCIAGSIPASNISWVEQTDDGNITMKQCQLKTVCVIAIQANLTQQRKFICQTHYLETSDQKTLTVNILENNETRYKDLNNSASGDKSYIWIILGTCLAVLFVAVTVCLITRKKLRNIKAKLEANQVRISANPDRVRNEEDKLDDAHGNLNDCAHGFDDSEVTYSQPVKNKPSSNADVTYSEVNKTEKSNSSASCSKKTQQDGQLLYADLDFDPNDAPLKGTAAKRRNSPTEYVAIDFVKTAAEKAEESKPTEADNIYANQ